MLMSTKIATIIAMSAALLVAACEPPGTTSQRQGEKDQEELMQRAINSMPTPQASNFLTRQSVIKWMERQDVPDRPHYIYVYSDMGQVIGYYVAQSRPVSTCTFLTPPMREYEVGGGAGPHPLGPAPALDGVYYGQGGACDQWFFFDAETDAMIELTGFKIFTADQPLALDAEPIRVEPADGD